MERQKLTAGQTLWFVPGDSRHIGQSREITVIKIGRKWAELSGYIGRADIETWCIDGGVYSSPGRLYASRAEWRAERDRALAWDALHRHFQHRSAPDTVSMEDIKAAGKLLGFTPPTPAPRADGE